MARARSDVEKQVADLLVTAKKALGLSLAYLTRMDGTPVIPDVRALPDAMRLPAARFPRIRSYVSVPVVLSAGTVYGTFCGAGFTADKGLTADWRTAPDVCFAEAYSIGVGDRLELLALSGRRRAPAAHRRLPRHECLARHPAHPRVRGAAGGVAARARRAGAVRA